MPEDQKRQKKLRRFEIKRGAAALLYARSYRWACLKCGHAQLEDGCPELVECRECLSRFEVAAVHHVADRNPLSPGTSPAKLFGPAPVREEPDSYVLPLEKQPVHLTATGYQWVCVECDPWCELPQHTHTALVDSVRCRHCHAQYAVGEVRHWRGLPLTCRERTQHALRIHIVDDDTSTEEPKVAPAERNDPSVTIL